MNRILLLLFSVFSINCLFSGCNLFSQNDMNEQESLITKQLYDSFTATGKHGYFTVMFIVGRLKTSPISEGLPVAMTVLKIDPELIGQEMKLKMEDSTHYQIMYPKNEKEDEVINGVFESDSGNERFQVRLTKSFSNEVFESVKMIDYTFKIHAY